MSETAEKRASNDGPYFDAVVHEHVELLVARHLFDLFDPALFELAARLAEVHDGDDVDVLRPGEGQGVADLEFGADHVVTGL
ncbi:hypothetical protein ACSLFT_19790 [Streptomyces sp. G6]|uniref:hypothetical protein n=1 Tax=Streptomyces sp. G6 TaxID=1178736 RepID=UPI003ED884EE